MTAARADLRELWTGLTGRQKGVVAVCYAAGILAPASFGLSGPLMGKLAEATHSPVKSVGGAFGLVFIAFLLAPTLIGRGADRFGARAMLLIGAVLLAAAELSNVWVDALPWLMVNNVVAGFGIITLLVAAQTRLTTVTAGKTQAAALSLWAMTAYVGSPLGLWLAGTLTDTGAWRLTYAVHAGAVIALAAAALVIMRSGEGHAEPVIRHAPRLNLLREGGVFRLSLGYMLTTASTVASISVWPLYLSKVHGAPVGAIAKLTAVVHPVALAGAMAVGFYLSRAVSPGKIAIAFVIGASASVAMLFSPERNLAILGAALALWAVCAGAWSAFYSAMLPRVVRERSNIGAATGLIHQIGAFGSIGGPPLYSAIMASDHANPALIAVTTVLWAAPLLILPIWGRGAQPFELPPQAHEQGGERGVPL